MKTKLTASDFLSEIRQYLDAKYGENYIFSPTMIDPTTLGVQMAIMENTNHGVERKFDLVIKDIVEQIKNMEKNIGDLVWLDGYTSLAQQNSQEFEIKQKEYRFDEISGEKFPIYFVNDRWFDGRDGGGYNDEKCMYYIELT
jgi:hypothetical protein